MPQSIKTKTIEGYREEYEDKLLCFAKSENIYSRFMVGEKQSKDEGLHTIMMHKKMCPINCEVVDYIRDVISGREGEKLMKWNKPLSYFIKLEQGKEEYIFDWNEIQW